MEYKPLTHYQTELLGIDIDSVYRLLSIRQSAQIGDGNYFRRRKEAIEKRRMCASLQTIIIDYFTSKK
jgi:hypothetical protein